jgi:hypothetical protein
LNGVFSAEDATKEIAEIEAGLPAVIDRQREALARDAPSEIGPGDQCSAPYVCEFFQHCNPELPENHVSCLPRGQPNAHPVGAAGASRVCRNVFRGETAVRGPYARIPPRFCRAISAIAVPTRR